APPTRHPFPHDALPILPLYFPRSHREEAAARALLPADTGNELGETYIEERKIRISSALPALADPPADPDTDSAPAAAAAAGEVRDRKSTRLNSSHVKIS